MKNTILWALVALNVLLLISFVGRFTKANVANAQARRPADYVMIPGEVPGGTGDVVYMIDTSNGLLGAMVYDDTRKELQSMPPIDINRVFQGGAGIGAGGPTGVTPGYGARKVPVR